MRYQQRMARLVERKIQQTREKLAVLGARDEDDYGLVLPPEGFVPELPGICVGEELPVPDGEPSGLYRPG